MTTPRYSCSGREACATTTNAVQATASNPSVAATGSLRDDATKGQMPLAEKLTSRVLTGLEEAQLTARRAGQFELARQLQIIAVDVADWQRGLDEEVYKLYHGWLPDDGPAPTPWFARRRRETAELRAEIVDLDAERRKRAAS